ncbi:hypothetical protein PR202_ga31417 [Eleusine coracana subsp. coracana]|uniref:Uncharacterized protein n=1 Tax=Eleusine coracana subsp. coracana TaxID=191504 RepID=A0AAV5DRE0_ELECO|nr:hypothetical protein PR202_ga31417 [Eleusine coracana subsp. coracana]
MLGPCTCLGPCPSPWTWIPECLSGGQEETSPVWSHTRVTEGEAVAESNAGVAWGRAAREAATGEEEERVASDGG